MKDAILNESGVARLRLAAGVGQALARAIVSA